MNISAINCTPIRPKVNFGSLDEQEQYLKIQKVSDELNQIVTSDDIKKPIAVASSVALAALGAYASGKALTSCFTNKVANNAGLMVENGLKKASGIMTQGAKKLLAAPAEPKSKMAAAKHLTGKLIEKTESGARSLYSKFVAAPIPENIPNGLTKEQAKANNMLSNLVGKASAAGSLYYVATTDNDGDGVKDIMQKSRNVYTGAQNESRTAFNALNLVGDLVSALT